MGRLEKGGGIVALQTPPVQLLLWPHWAFTCSPHLSSIFCHCHLGFISGVHSEKNKSGPHPSPQGKKKESQACLLLVSHSSLVSTNHLPLSPTPVHGSTVLSLWASKLLLTLFPPRNLCLTLSRLNYAALWMLQYTRMIFYYISTIWKDHFLVILSIHFSLFWRISA